MVWDRNCEELYLDSANTRIFLQETASKKLNSQIAKKFRNSSTVLGNSPSFFLRSVLFEVYAPAKVIIFLSADIPRNRLGASLVLEGPGSGHEECYGTFKKLARNTEYSKFDNSKKLSVLAWPKFLVSYQTIRVWG